MTAVIVVLKRAEMEFIFSLQDRERAQVLYDLGGY